MFVLASTQSVLETRKRVVVRKSQARLLVIIQGLAAAHQDLQQPMSRLDRQDRHVLPATTAWPT